MKRVDEIQARLAQATPGPWTFSFNPHNTGRPMWRITTPDRGHNKEDFFAASLSESDADLIAHAPTDLAYLLTRLAALEEFAATQVRAARMDERKRLDGVTEHVSLSRRAELCVDMLEQLGQDRHAKVILLTKYLTLAASRHVQLDRRRRASQESIDRGAGDG